MIDHDPKPGQAPMIKEGVVEAICSVWPAFRHLPKWWTPSTSACIYDLQGGQLTGEGSGFHLYFPFRPASRLPELADLLFKRLWLAGHGNIFITRAGSMLPRTIFDASVFSPERLDFVGGANCIDCEQRLPPPVFIQPEHAGVREKYHAAVLLVHHVGHGDKTRARGAMALKGALDFEYRLERGTDDIIRLDCTKCKDFETPGPMAFKLRPVELPLKDEGGRPITSAVLDSVEYEPPARPGKTGRGKNQTKALSVLSDLLAHHQDNLVQDGREPASARVTIDEWRLGCDGEGIGKNRFYEVKSALERNGDVIVTNCFVTPCN